MVLVTALLISPAFAAGQQSAAPTPANTPPQANATQSGPARIALDDAIRMALLHNHALQRCARPSSRACGRSHCQSPPQSHAGPRCQFPSIFQPNQFSSDYIDQQAQFDAGVGYLFERGKKRQHRLQAAQDQTIVVRSQVSDSERQLIFNVGQQFIDVLLAESTLEFAQQDLDSFQKTWTSQRAISRRRSERRRFSEDQAPVAAFQSDVSAANWPSCKAWPLFANCSASSPFPMTTTCKAHSTTSRSTPI